MIKKLLAISLLLASGSALAGKAEITCWDRDGTVIFQEKVATWYMTDVRTKVERFDGTEISFSASVPCRAIEES